MDQANGGLPCPVGHLGRVLVNWLFRDHVVRCTFGSTGMGANSWRKSGQECANPATKAAKRGPFSCPEQNPGHFPPMVEDWTS